MADMESSLHARFGGKRITSISTQSITQLPGAPDALVSVAPRECRFRKGECRFRKGERGSSVEASGVSVQDLPTMASQRVLVYECVILSGASLRVRACRLHQKPRSTPAKMATPPGERERSSFIIRGIHPGEWECGDPVSSTEGSIREWAFEVATRSGNAEWQRGVGMRSGNAEWAFEVATRSGNAEWQRGVGI